MPPHIAPIQVTIVPVAMHKEGVLERAKALAAELEAAGVRVNVDDTDRRPGFKFAECEMRGVPLRIELGPKDIEAGSCVLVRRDNGEKSEAALEGIAVTVADMLETIQKAMYERAKEHRDTHTYDVKEHGGVRGDRKEPPGLCPCDVVRRSRLRRQDQRGGRRNESLHSLCPGNNLRDLCLLR